MVPRESTEHMLSRLERLPPLQGWDIGIYVFPYLREAVFLGWLTKPFRPLSGGGGFFILENIQLELGWHSGNHFAPYIAQCVLYKERNGLFFCITTEEME